MALKDMHFTPVPPRDRWIIAWGKIDLNQSRRREYRVRWNETYKCYTRADGQVVLVEGWKEDTK